MGRFSGVLFIRASRWAGKEVMTRRCFERSGRPVFSACAVSSGHSRARGWYWAHARCPHVRAIAGASSALALSEIPFEKTIAGVRIGLVDGQFVVNPTFQQRKDSKLDLIVAGTKDGLVMVEAGAKEVTEEQAIQALETAHA